MHFTRTFGDSDKDATPSVAKHVRRFGSGIQSPLLKRHLSTKPSSKSAKGVATKQTRVFGNGSVAPALRQHLNTKRAFGGKNTNPVLAKHLQQTKVLKTEVSAVSGETSKKPRSMGGGATSPAMSRHLISKTRDFGHGQQSPALRRHFTKA